MPVRASPSTEPKAGRIARAVGLALALLSAACARPSAPAPGVASTDPGAAARGRYLTEAADCAGCHTRPGGARFAGGRAIVTPFGTYYSDNITPDPAAGIGAWSDADFLRAMRQGTSPNGDDYFPAFPFPSFTAMTDRDILDIRAYLAMQPPAAQPDRPPDAAFPFNMRAAMGAWRLLYFTPGPYVGDPRQSVQWNRGAYLANAVAHCGECHTPRGPLGAIEHDRRFAGTLSAKRGVRAPNITPDPVDGIGKWSIDDIADLLKLGVTPQGDFVGREMADVVTGTSHLTDADRRAIAVYLKSVPPLHDTGDTGS